MVAQLTKNYKEMYSVMKYRFQNNIRSLKSLSLLS